MTTQVLRRISVGALSVILVGCSNLPSPSSSAPSSPIPSMATSPSPSPSAAGGPKVTCDGVPDYWLPTDASGSPIPVTLTCANVVAAAETAVGPDPGITSIEFHYFFWCPPGRYCAITTANDSHVIFHLTGRRPDILVQVHVGEAGRVTASSPQPLPSPSS
jgi:hypothetical protein